MDMKLVIIAIFLPVLVYCENKMLIKTMCGDLQEEMVINNMPEYRSGVRLNACIKAGSYSLVQTQAVIYEADAQCSMYTLKYFNSSTCSSGSLFQTDPPHLMDGSSCYESKYIYACGTIADVSVNEYSGIVQYGYEDDICGTLDYFMQYGCATDASECINLEPFGAPDSAKVYCNGGNGSTIHYGGTYECDVDPVISSRPEESCAPYEDGVDDQFSQGAVFFTATATRSISCSNDSNDDDSGTPLFAIILLIIAGFVVIGAVVVYYYYFKTKQDVEMPSVSQIESPLGHSTGNAGK